jgi:hypothetical protein
MTSFINEIAKILDFEVTDIIPHLSKPCKGDEVAGRSKYFAIFGNWGIPLYCHCMSEVPARKI